MKLDKLAKQIKKELTRNPKKTAALALVTVVALWFWSPLAMKWMGGKKAKAKTPNAVAAETAPVSTDAAAPVAKALPKIVWNKMLDRIAHDERMTTAMLDPKKRDPFALTTAEAQIVAVQPVVPGSQNASTAIRPVVVSDPTPQSLGLILEGTFVTRNTKRATISGKHYEVGGKVKIAATTPAADATPPATAESEPATEKPTVPPIEFVVTSIEARRVVLAREGKEYALVIKRPTLNDEEQWTFRKSP